MSNDGGQGNLEKAGEALGRVAGQMTDRAMEMTGTVFNSMTQMMGSWWSGSDAQQAASSFTEDHDRACRNHHQSAASKSGRTTDYESSRPLYQMGHVASRNPSYAGRSFDEVEPDLRRSWEAGPGGQYGSWPEVRDYVGYSYNAAGTSRPASDASGSASQGGAGQANAGGRADMNASGSTAGRTSIEGDASIGGTHVSGSIRMEGGAAGGGRDQAQGGARGGSAGGAGSRPL